MLPVPKLIILQFCRRARDERDRPAIFALRGEKFRPHTWGEIASDVRRLAAALVGAGVASDDRVAVVSPNRYEWIVADLGCQLARAIHVPIHAALAGSQIGWQIGHC